MASRRFNELIDTNNDEKFMLNGGILTELLEQ